MKAYKISDLKGYADYSTVVFAETSGKAKAIAITTDAFNDYEFTEISARRVPELDKYYRGLDEMDWLDDADRIALVRTRDLVATLNVGKKKIAKAVLQSNGVIGVRWQNDRIA